MNLIPRRKRERKRWYPFSQTRVAKVAAASGLRSFLLSLSLSDFLVSIQSLSLSLSLSSVLLSLSSVLLSLSLSLSCVFFATTLLFFSLSSRSHWFLVHVRAKIFLKGDPGGVNYTVQVENTLGSFVFCLKRRENLKKQGDVISISTHFVHVILQSLNLFFCFLFFGFPCESCPSL